MSLFRGSPVFSHLLIRCHASGTRIWYTRSGSSFTGLCTWLGSLLCRSPFITAVIPPVLLPRWITYNCSPTGSHTAQLVDMSSDDEVGDLQDTLQAAVDLADNLPSATPSQAASPATLRANHELIIKLQERMIQAGQLKPISIGDELDTVALHLESLPGPTASQPLQPEIRESAETTMASIRRVVRKRVSDEDIDTVFEELDSVVNGISTPTSSQPRDPEVLERSKKAFNELAADMRRKKILAPRTRKPNKNKVSAHAQFAAERR